MDVLSASSERIDEPDSIKKWREEFLKNIEKKDELEVKMIAEMEQKGMEDLQKWISDYRNQLVSSLEQNKEHDNELRKKQEESVALSASLSNCTSAETAIWDRIDSLTQPEFGQKSNKEELTRMKSLINNLKSNPIQK